MEAFLSVDMVDTRAPMVDTADMADMADMILTTTIIIIMVTTMTTLITIIITTTKTMFDNTKICINIPNVHLQLILDTHI